MLKIIITIGVLVAAGIAVVLLLAVAKPKTFRIERSVFIKAAPEKISPFIANFHNWPLWSPFEKMDPNMKRNFGGAIEGKGAIYSWEGNAKAGAGSMEVVNTTPQVILIKLNFSKPMKAQNTTEITFTPSNGDTRVTWAMYGDNSYIANIFHVFIDMDKMVGPSFEEGLAKLKDVAEKQ